MYAHTPLCESLFLSRCSTAKSGMSMTPSDMVSFNQVSVMNAIVIFLQKINSRTSSTLGTRDIMFATRRFGTLQGVSLWVDPVPGFCEQSAVNLNILLVLGWFMQMMFFGFDGVRNHRRKCKARKVNIHFASTDNDRNGSLFPLSCLFAPLRWRKT